MLTVIYTKMLKAKQDYTQSMLIGLAI